MLSAWFQEEPKMPLLLANHNRDLMTQERPKTAQDKPKLALRWPKMAKDNQRCSQHGAKMGPRWPKRGPTRPHKAWEIEESLKKPCMLLPCLRLFLLLFLLVFLLLLLLCCCCSLLFSIEWGDPRSYEALNSWQFLIGCCLRMSPPSKQTKLAQN